MNNSSSFNAKGEKVQYFGNEDPVSNKLITSFQNKDSDAFVFSREEDPIDLLGRDMPNPNAPDIIEENEGKN
jgi:hypothetical protein